MSAGSSLGKGKYDPKMRGKEFLGKRKVLNVLKLVQGLGEKFFLISCSVLVSYIKKKTNK